MKVIPKKYKAKDSNGNVVTGWFVMLHIPIYGNDHQSIIGFEEIPSIFNDEQGERSKGSYWHTIILDTMEEVNEQRQLKLF